MRVALVHDWLTGHAGRREGARGHRRDLPGRGHLHAASTSQGSVSPAIESRRIRTSFIQRLPAAGRLYRHYLPLFPTAIEQFDLDGYDLVISSSHCAAKAVDRARPRAAPVLLPSPMRYAWDQFDAYFGAAADGPRSARRCYRPMLAWLARWDAATAPRVHRFVANSRFVAARIARYYDRPARRGVPSCRHGVLPPGRHGRPASRLWWCRRWCRTSGSTSRSRPARGPACRCASSATARNSRVSEALAGRRGHVLGAGSRARRFARSTAGPAWCCCPASRTSASCPSRPRRADGRWWRSAEGGALETVVDGVTGALVAEPSPVALGRRHPATLDARLASEPSARISRRVRRAGPRSAIRGTRARFGASGSHGRSAEVDRASPQRERHGQTLQTDARDLLRAVGRPAGRRGLRRRLPAPLQVRADPGHEGRAADRAVRQRAAVRRAARARGVLLPGPLQPPAQPLARRRLLRGVRRQRGRRRARASSRRSTSRPTTCRPR